MHIDFQIYEQFLKLQKIKSRNTFWNLSTFFKFVNIISKSWDNFQICGFFYKIQDFLEVHEHFLYLEPFLDFQIFVKKQKLK